MKNTIISIFLVFMFFAFFTGCEDSSSSEPGSIYGVVTDKTFGEPVKNADVKLIQVGLKSVTGRDGSFEFHDVLPGRYNLLVKKATYSDNESDTVIVESGKQSRVDLQLEKAPAALRIVDDAGKDISELDFGAEIADISRLFNIFNDGAEKLEWEISFLADWIVSVSKESGELQSQGTQGIIVYIDRSRLREGENLTQLHITSNDGNRQLAVKAALNNGVTRIAECKELPANAEWNEFDEIEQTFNGGEWIPTTKGTYNEKPSETECRFKCIENYLWNGSECILNPCLSDPCRDLANSTGKCSVTENFRWSCECEEPFAWNGSQCLHPCRPDNPCRNVENSTGICIREDDFTKYSCVCEQNYFWKNGGCISPCDPNPCEGIPNSSEKCTASAVDKYECECEEGFLWNGSVCNDPCDPNPCEGKANVTADYACIQVDADTYSCECEEDFKWNGSDCVNPCKPNPCETVANSTGVCIKEDEFALYKCECDTNYVWENGSCTGATKTFTCTGLPEHAQWNSVSSYIRTWNGTDWFPPETTAVYNEAASTAECRFKCSAGFFWNGTECTFPECGPGCTFPCTDSENGLIWSARTAGTKNLENATSFCDGLKEGDYSDWHLPNIDALRTLIQNCPNTSSGGKCNVSSSCLGSNSCYNSSDCSTCGAANPSISKLNDIVILWSSSVDSSKSSYNWVVDFSIGWIATSCKTCSDREHYVRCVRTMK